MPTASAAFGYRSSNNYATTYGSSYTSSSVGRSNSATRRSNLSNGYSSGTAATQYRTSRPLPHGPGPLDKYGRKLDSFSIPSYEQRSTRATRGSTVGAGLKSGPLKVDHGVTTGTTTRYPLSRTPDYLPSTSTLNRRNSRASLEPISTTASSSNTHRLSGGRRSASLANLRLDDDPPASNMFGNKSRFDTEHDRLARPSSRRGSRATEEHSLGVGSSGRTYGVGSDEANETGLGRSRYGPSALSRESSPGTSNGVGSRLRHYGDYAKEEMPRSKSSSSSSSTSANVSVLGKGKERDCGKVGLRNLGNTCFMNSVLQCLSNTRPLLDWCLQDGYLTNINTTTSGMKGALVKAFAALLKSLWKDGSCESYVSPNSFKTQIQKFAPRFMGYSQQDSQEFLRYLLEGIHEDVNRVTVKQKPIMLDDNKLESKPDREKAKEYWNAYIHRDSSHIVDIFVGQLKSELKFTECGHRSVTFDPFWDLSLSIPKNRTEMTLDDCLRLFMKEEELEAEERPMCFKCKMRRSCTKSFSIQRFPQILVVHLKRFSQERYGRKLSCLVDFPVKGLNLTDYSSESSQKVTYNLYAVSDHSGGVHSGHYTAICKNPYSGEWHSFNDTRVSPARSNQAVSSEAYVLFYELNGPAGKL